MSTHSFLFLFLPFFLCLLFSLDHNHFCSAAMTPLHNSSPRCASSIFLHSDTSAVLKPSNERSHTSTPHFPSLTQQHLFPTMITYLSYPRLSLAYQCIREPHKGLTLEFTLFFHVKWVDQHTLAFLYKRVYLNKQVFRLLQAHCFVFRLI